MQYYVQTFREDDLHGELTALTNKSDRYNANRLTADTTYYDKFGNQVEADAALGNVLKDGYTFDGKDMIKVPGLDGSGKMGKSEGNAINLFEEPASIRKKVMRAVTDSGPTEMNQEKPEAIQNLFTLMEIVSEPATVAFFNEQYNRCNIRYGDMKKQLAEDIIFYTAPIRERIVDILENDAYLAQVAKSGAEKARESASKTLKEVKEVVGIRKLF